MKKLGIRIGIVAVATIVVFYLVWFLSGRKNPDKKTGDGRTAAYHSQQSSSSLQPEPHEITISASRPSDPVSLYTRNGIGLRIVVDELKEDNVSFVIHWTGPSGTFDEHIPRRDKRPPGWQSSRPAENGRADSLTFQLAPGYPDSKLKYTLYPKN